MTVGERAYAALDFESAGAVKGATDIPVQIGIARMRRGEISTGLSTYLASDRPVTWSAREVHGIRDEDLAGAPRLLDLWPEIRAELADRWIVAHGAATEKRFLRAFPLHGFGPWVDTLTLSRAAWPDLPSHALGDVIAALHLEGEARSLYPGFRWHDALSDSLAALVLLRHFIAFTGIRNEPEEILLRADSAAYYRKKNGLRNSVSGPPTESRPR